MKKTIRIAFLLFFLLLFLLIGVFTARSSIQRRVSLDLSEGPTAADEWIGKYIPGRQELLSPYRLWNTAVDKRYFPDNNAFINESGQFLMGSKLVKEGIREAAKNILRLSEHCREQGKNFLFIVYPGKPEYDEELLRLGIPCHRNETADLMLLRMQRYHIPYLDLRELFRAEDDYYSYFYKTEHHWNADAGLKAARAIAQKLNEEFDMGLDTGRIEDAVIGREVYPDVFVGEQGMKALGKYGERDSFIVRFPLYDTHMRYLCHDDRTDVSGGFEILTDPSVLTTDHLNGGRSMYYYYLFKNSGLVEIWNEDVPKGDILFIKDSFANVVTPFLSLTANHVTTWDMRTDKRVISYLARQPEIETVIIAYQLGFIATTYMNDFQ